MRLDDVACNGTHVKTRRDAEIFQPSRRRQICEVRLQKTIIKPDANAIGLAGSLRYLGKAD